MNASNAARFGPKKAQAEVVMSDYRSVVESALRSIGCDPIEPLGLGIVKWYSPRTKHSFVVDLTIPTKRMANEVLRQAGHGPLFPEI